MVLLQDRSAAERPQARLTLQTELIGKDITAIRCLDWDRSRFDIEFELQNGTTYNSFLIRAEKVALVDTSHAKFQNLYREMLLGSIELDRLDYLIVSHTEPDHSGLVADILELAPQVTVVGSKVAIQFLREMVHRPFTSQIVKSGDRLDLGEGRVLEFISAPNLHWPDTLFTYDPVAQILFTCDAFGMHYCDEHLYDEVPQHLEADFKYYYDCLMGPNARSVLMALKRIEGLQIQQIATGHGPLLKHHVGRWLQSYRHWSESQAKTAGLAVVFYAEGCEHGNRIVEALARGLHKTGTEVELVDLASVSLQEVRELATVAAALAIGMPERQSSEARTAISTILASAGHKQGFGLFETGSGEGDPLYPLRTQFQDLGLAEVFPPILVPAAPTPSLLQLCEEAGTDMGQWIVGDRSTGGGAKQPAASSLERALGRLSTGLYVATACKGEVTGAMLASWVMQAGTTPPGITVAVAKDRAIESLMQVGDSFVLNVLEEGNSQKAIAHFLTRFPPGADRFADIKTCLSERGIPILADALAYLECEATGRIDAGDHWIVYGTVLDGRVAKATGIPAVHHRTVGNHY